MKLRSRIAYLLAILFCLVAGFAQAQEFPKGPVKLVVPFPPGGPTDIVGRIVAQKLGEVWNSSVIVENRPGAGTSSTTGGSATW